MIYDRVEITIDDGIADVRLSRPEKMNALDGKMFNAIVEATRQLASDSNVRVVVLSGEGGGFCAGLDTENVTGSGSTGPASSNDDVDLDNLLPRTHGIANLPQYAAWAWRELPVPVIAAVHGVAFGGGFQIALGADMRYAAPETRFSVMEIKWGLVPDMAGTQLMKHLAREDVVRELSYTGRVFTAQQALEYGFVTAVTEEPRALAMETARLIVDKNPDAIRANKRLCNASRDLSSQRGLLMESEEQQNIIGSENQIEAVMAQVEKRSAVFI